VAAILLTLAGCSRYAGNDIEIGVLEDRETSRNCKVFIVSESRMVDIAKVVSVWEENRKALFDNLEFNENRHRQLLEDIADARTDIVKANILDSPNLKILGEFKLRTSKAYAEECEFEIINDKGKIFEAYAKFLDTLSDVLSDAAIGQKRTDMSGVAKFSGIVEQRVVIFALPSADSKLQYGYSKLNVTEQRKQILELKTLFL